MALNASDAAGSLAVIGLTTYLQQAQTGAWDVPAAFLHKTYLDAVTGAGGIATLLPPQPVDAEIAARVLDRLDGLILTGGRDVDPAAYNDEPHPATDEPAGDRDAWEFALRGAALRRGMPVLGDIDTGIYVKPGIDTFFRDRAIPAADLVTPNHFELEHLTGRTVSTMSEALSAARTLLRGEPRGPRLALITSLRRADASADTIEMVAVTPDAAWRVATPMIGFEIAPNGTGDAVAALFTAHWIGGDDVADALGKAASSIFAVLEATQAMGERELQLVAAQDRLVAPPRAFKAEKL